MTEKKDQLQQILDIAIALSAEKNPDKLWHKIVDTAMELTGADGGTLYVLDGEQLVFRIMRTLSKGIDVGKEGETINLPPVPLGNDHICAYAAVNKQALNIENVYESTLFDFSGPKRYDAMNDYHTQSMVAIPMINGRDEVIGVMQLINAMDSDGKVRPFTQAEEHILLAMSSLTAIAMSNLSYLEELTTQMWSFTEAMTEAIDARTPYNGSHTRKVAEYSGMLVDKINQLHEAGEAAESFDEEHRDQVVMAALLHDIGKMIVPLEVMNKQTRLSGHKEKMLDRLEIIKLHSELDFAKELCSEEDYQDMQAQVAGMKALIEKVDGAGFIDDELMGQVVNACSQVYVSPDGCERIPFATEEEKVCMTIRKGTLTLEERKAMENHAAMTARILAKVHFNNRFKQAPIWAAQHHECLDGTGYPDGLPACELGIEVRILSVADICDALLATDRPYKKPLPKEKAFAIMHSMAAEGKIDDRLVGYLEECLSE